LAAQVLATPDLEKVVEDLLLVVERGVSPTGCRPWMAVVVKVL
jgi:hypothetical protein